MVQQGQTESWTYRVGTQFRRAQCGRPVELQLVLASNNTRLRSYLRCTSLSVSCRSETASRALDHKGNDVACAKYDSICRASSGTNYTWGGSPTYTTLDLDENTMHQDVQ